MTLDKAIKQQMDFAKINEYNSKSCKDSYSKECYQKYSAEYRQLAEWLMELREAQSIIRVCNRVLGFLLECEIESTSTRHEVETLLKSITEYLSGGSENGS